MYGSINSFFNNKVKSESFIYIVEPNSSILNLYYGLYDSNNIFEKTLFLSGIYLFNLKAIQAGEYLVDDSLYQTLLKMKFGETITRRFVI